MSKKLLKKVIYKGTIVLKTGLHIGGSNTQLNIGGPDNFIIRNPINNMPYIPGSSLKGKLRALSELFNGEIDAEGEVSKDSTKGAGLLFGTSADKKTGHASRLIVRDAELSNPEDLQHTEMPYSESKTEASINRLTSMATPRTFERVPAGAKFHYEMVLNVFEGEDEQRMKATLKQAINLLKDDYLGGNGSRGYGQVDFIEEEPIEKTDY